MKKTKTTILTALIVTCVCIVTPLLANAISSKSSFFRFTSSLSALSARLTFPDLDKLFTIKKSPQKSEEAILIKEELSFDNIDSFYGWSWVLEDFSNQEEAVTIIPPLNMPSEEILSAIPYPDSIEDNDGSIMTMQYGFYTDPYYINLKNGGQVRNCTSVSNEILANASQELPLINIQLNSTEPQVLIYHTHATESFEPYTRDFYDADFSCKTTDIEKNMIAVGDEIVKELEAAGIRTLHDTTIHDYPSYNEAYNSSRKSVSEILAMYPSIKVVLDVHRDGIERTDGTRIAPIVEVDGKRAAQIMIISCCDDGSGNIPLYMENFKLASLLQSQLETDYEGITRPVLFDYRFYNQDLSTGSLLIEIGSHGNSIDEATYSGKLVGKSIANALKGLC